MTLNESVAKLSSLLPALKVGDAKFASDLIASFKKFGGLTPRQEPWIGKLIARAEAPVFSAPVAAPVVNVGGFSGVIALFNKAKESGLKFPKVRLVVNGTTVILSVNGPKSKAPGFVSLQGEGKYPNRSYFGRVSPDGLFQPFKGILDPAFQTALTTLLTEFSKNPARVAKDHGKLTGNCCFCNKALGLGKEQRSVLVGFGPDCAENYGLKAEWLAAAEKAEAAASVLPTLTVTPAAQAVIEGLAADLAKATGAVKVTVTDGPVAATYNAAEIEAIAAELAEFNPDELQAELGPEYVPESVTVEPCYFCDKPSVDVVTGYAVCAGCKEQLN